MPDSVLGTEDTAAQQQMRKKTPALLGLTFREGKETINKLTQKIILDGNKCE